MKLRDDTPVTESASERTEEALASGAERGAPEDPVRAAVLSTLAEAGGSLALASVADRVADDVDGATGTSRRERVQRLYLALVRRHVPALEEHGIVVYDRASGELRLAGSADD